jgi:hypothetical protein
MSCGLLVIWNDCVRGRETDYEEWYQDEHLKERLGVPGFTVGRRYEAVEASRRFLTAYEVEHPETLTSPEYLGRLEHPSARTTAIMRDGFCNARRAICERNAVQGPIRGGVVVTVALDEPAPWDRLLDLAERHPVSPERVHTEIWLSTSPEDGARSAEAELRGRDDTMSGCLELEFLREAPALRARDDLDRACPHAEVGVYRLLCSLRKGDLA